MIIETFEQYSPEWWAARTGIPTGSCFGKIVTPSGKPSASSGDYMDELLHEWRTGEIEESYKSKAMDDGSEREPEARARMAFDYNLKISEVGIIYKDERKLVAVSPDGLFVDGNDSFYTGGAEIKNPIGKTMVRYIGDGGIPSCYKPQIYGSMWVTGLDRWIFMANCPGYKPLYVEAKPEKSYMKAFDLIMNSFIDRMLERREQLKPYLE